MKHPRKKFRFEKQLSEIEFANFEKKAQIYNLDQTSFIKPKKTQQSFLITDNKFIIEAFLMNINGNQIYIPEPDPCLIYFNNAYVYFREIEKQKNELNKYFATFTDKQITDEMKHKLYNYYGVSCGCIIFMFLSLESIINRTIPEDFEYKKEMNNKTELYNKDQIQKYISFDEKFSKIIPKIINKNFEKEYPLKNQRLKDLKDFRDSIIHTKTQSNEATPYAGIFKKSFSFNYEKAMECTKDYLNFVQDSFIEDCPCGNEF